MFTREDTKAFKGVAVLLMMAAHLTVFPDRMPIGYEIIPMATVSGRDIEDIIGTFAKISVSIFMFLGGYGMWCQADAHGDGQVSIGKHIVKLYQSLWKVMLIFVPIGFLFFEDQPAYAARTSQCYKFSEFSWETFLRNFTGWHASYNGEWWFFRAYLCVMFLGCIFVKLIWKHKNLYGDIGLVMLWEVLSVEVMPAVAGLECFSTLNQNIFFDSFFNSYYGGGYSSVGYMASFLMGVVVAKYDGLKRLDDLFEELPPLPRLFSACLVQVLIVYMRAFLDGSPAIDVICVPMMISSGLVLFRAVPAAERVFQFLGKYSTSMWLTHTFFCYYFYPFVKLVYVSRNGLIALLTLTALSLAASILLELFWKNPLFQKIYYLNVPARSRD